MSQGRKLAETDKKALLANAQKGDRGAQYWLGAAYEGGWFGKPDYQEALKWLRKAAAHGDPDAQVSLGQMYEGGEGVEQNYVLAAKWYRKAANHVPDLGGAGQGRNHLGLLYLDGLGVRKDYVQAYMWFSLTNFETNLSYAKAQMTPAQIQKAGRMAAEWKSRHPDPLRDGIPKEVPESCPVTKAPVHPLVPPYPAEFYPDSFWFGSEKLWISLPADGTWKGLPHYNPTDTAFRQKLLWWHKGFDGRKNQKPILRVNGKRLDSPAPTFEEEQSANTYGGPDSRFIVVGIDIPTLGCWKIKGVFGAAELSFVVWVTQ